MWTHGKFRVHLVLTLLSIWLCPMMHWLLSLSFSDLTFLGNVVELYLYVTDVGVLALQ